MEVFVNSTYYGEISRETDYTESTSRVNSTYTDVCNDQYNENADAWVKHFVEVTKQINKTGDEIDECLMSLSQATNEIKETKFKLEELESRREYKEQMITNKQLMSAILTERKYQLLESSKELMYKLQDLGEEHDKADIEKLNQLEDLVEKRNKIAGKIESVNHELNDDVESLGSIAKETEAAKLKLKELLLHESYIAETIEINKALMDVSCKRLVHLIITVDGYNPDI